MSSCLVCVVRFPGISALDTHIQGSHLPHDEPLDAPILLALA